MNEGLLTIFFKIYILELHACSLTYLFLFWFTGEPTSDSSFGRREKARRKMTTKADLLYNDTDFGDIPNMSLPPVLPSSRNPSSFQRSLSFVKPSQTDIMTRSRSFVKTNNR